jgi:hypothetical protein
MRINGHFTTDSTVEVESGSSVNAVFGRGSYTLNFFGSSEDNDVHLHFKNRKDLVELKRTLDTVLADTSK